MNSNEKEIEKFIDDIKSISVDYHEILVQTRKLFKKASSSLEEDIKYGELVFLKDGELVGGIFVYKAHLSVEFSRGTEF